MSNETTTTEKQVLEVLKSQGVEFSTRFVKPAKPFTAYDLKNHPQLKFEITLKKANLSCTFDYSKGYGHCHWYTQGRITSDMAENILYELNNGKYRVKNDYHLTKQTRMPTADEAIYCLLIDADAMNHTFNEWCDTFGYDSDSIKALKIYDRCIANGRKLQRLFSHKALTELKTILEDF